MGFYLQFGDIFSKRQHFYGRFASCWMLISLNSDLGIVLVLFYSKMQQQHLNKCEIIETGGMQIEEQHEKCSHIEQAKTNNVSREGKNLQKEIIVIEPNGSPKVTQNHSPTSQSPKQLSLDKIEPIQEDESIFVYHKKLDKKLKIKHNKKCSGCLKKHLNKDVLCCSNCPKSYHRICLNSQKFKITSPFFCSNCQEIIKERQQRKSMKKQISTSKQIQLRKFVKTQEKVNRKIISVQDANPSIQKEFEEFAETYPLYIQNGKIQFPIEDQLLQKYSLIMPKNGIASKPPVTKQLSVWFGTILEAWNTMQTFQEDFLEYSRLSTFELSQLLECKHKLIAVEKLFIGFLNFIIRDIFNERFESNKAYLNNPFLYLLKYCNETGSLQRIFKYVWVQFLHQISQIADFSTMFLNPTFKALLSNLRKKVNELWMPDIFQQRILLLQSILDGIIQSNSYHEDLYLKIQKGRQNTRQKNDSIQKIKEMEYELKEIIQKKKAASKQYRDKNKQANHSLDKSKFQKQLDRLENQQKRLETEAVKLREIIQIQKQNLTVATNGSTYTNVWFLGKDREHRDYWFIPNNRNKIFVNNQSSSQWFQYDLASIYELPKSLNPKGVREKQLLQNIQAYRKNNQFGSVNQSTESQFTFYQQQHKQFQINRENYILSSVDVDFDQQQYISFDFIRKMLILGERKIFNYLDQKNARWGTTQDRESYFNRVSSASTNRELIEAAKFLNQKICVVEIQYQVVDEEGQEHTDYSKMRKVQTKMWGINEKYKHAWLQYLANCDENLIIQVFFLNAILYLTIDRYVSKMRDTKKPKRDFIEQVPVNRQNKILNKRNSNQQKKANKFQWEETCDVCKQFGELLCCDLCPKVFHLGCIGLSQIPEGNYQCNQCESKRHTRSITKKIVDISKI